MEFHLDGSVTRLRLTEQLAYLDGRHDLGERICGTGEGLDRLVLAGSCLKPWKTCAQLKN
jgi:hypothetical protein